MEFDFDFDFDLDTTDWQKPTVNGLALLALKKDRVTVSINKGTEQLSFLVGEFDPTKIYTFISVRGGFSSINFIDYIIKKHKIIDDLTVATLAVGKKQAQHLEGLNIKKALFVVAGIFQQRGLDVKYDYFDIFKDVCKEKGWRYVVASNHSKVILMQAGGFYYVLETSSNLNENPKIEQFTFQEDKALYDFYKAFYEELAEGSK